MTYRELRTKLNWTQLRMANLLGMQRRVYHELEKREHLTTSNRALLNSIAFLHVKGLLEEFERDVIMRRG